MSSHPLKGGVSTLQPRLEALVSSTNFGYGAQTIRANGSSSRSDTTLKTPIEQLQGPVLRVDRCSLSIPTSPNYFDLLSEKEEEPLAATLPPHAEGEKARKRVSFAHSPPRQVTGSVHAACGIMEETQQKPPPQGRQTMQKKKQQKQKPLVN